MKLKILFVGEAWSGSSARSLRESLSLLPGVSIDDICEDIYRPKGQSLIVRICNRILKKYYQKELSREIIRSLSMCKPKVLLVYKGNLVTDDVIKKAREFGVFTVNIFPDYSPHNHGKQLRKAIGEYDLVISTKLFHPDNWFPLYKYSNKCVFVPHGYDSRLHLWTDHPGIQDLDIVMASNWRLEYEHILIDFAQQIQGLNINVALAGNGWESRRSSFPKHWNFMGPLHGRSYGEFLRRGKIVIAPMNGNVIIGDSNHFGDQDTTRTYELAAAGCFFVHKRSTFLPSLYDEKLEVPLWSNAEELAKIVIHFLPLDLERRNMAIAAHRRAVPMYSIDSRATNIVEAIYKNLPNSD